MMMKNTSFLILESFSLKNFFGSIYIRRKFVNDTKNMQYRYIKT